MPLAMRGQLAKYVQQMPGKQRRAYYRLRYPLTERPTYDFSGHEYTVSEISEGGIRVTLLDGQDIGPIGTETEGTLHFPDGTSVVIEGAVQRLGPHEAVLRLSDGISFRKMLSEQIRVRDSFPGIFDTISSTDPDDVGLAEPQ